MKDIGRGGKAGALDWIAASVTFVSSLFLVGFGLFKPALVQGMGTVSIVFGILGMVLGAGRIRMFMRPPDDRMYWWYEHLSGMIGSYIAAWTAFSVVTLPRIFGKSIYLWLWPIAVGVPAIILTRIYYQKKFALRRQVAAAN